MAAEHSRTPWHQDSARPEMVFDADGRLVVDCDHHGLNPRARAEANGALVAAAPDLLTQLRGAVAMMRLAISSLGIDPDLTEIEFRANGEHIARVSMASLLSNGQAAVTKAEGR